MEQLILNGKRLQLREIRKEDLPILLIWRNSTSFQENCLAVKNLCTIDSLDNEIKSAYQFDRYAQFIAWDDKNRPIGTNWIYRYSRSNGIAYTTTYVSDEFRNTYSYGIEMFLLVCKFMFDGLECRKVYAEVHSNNYGSVKIFHKVNATIEGYFHKHIKINDMEFADLLVFAIYKEHFLNNNLLKRFIK